MGKVPDEGFTEFLSLEHGLGIKTDLPYNTVQAIVGSGVNCTYWFKYGNSICSDVPTRCDTQSTN